jgi:hypothetical protein
MFIEDKSPNIIKKTLSSFEQLSSFIYYDCPLQQRFEQLSFFIYCDSTSPHGRTCRDCLATYEDRCKKEGKTPVCPHCKSHGPIRAFPTWDGAHKPKPAEPTQRRNNEGLDAVAEAVVALQPYLQEGENLVQGHGPADRWLFFALDEGLRIGLGSRPGFCLQCSARFNLGTMELEHLPNCPSA